MIYSYEPPLEPFHQFHTELLKTVLAGYGPFRRPDTQAPKRAGPPRREEAFLTLFDDAAGIEALEDWLQQLDYASKDGEVGSDERRKHLRGTLKSVKVMIDSLWPEEGKVRMEVNAEGVCFVGENGAKIPLREMSDGYRTMFALACDLLREATKTIGFLDVRGDAKRPALDMPGIVLIDEVDAHLHPKWQREIGLYLQRAFPRVQFIVATHSPFVAQAATEVA